MRAFVFLILALSASAQGGVFQDIQRLYPYFSADEIRLKREASTTPFKFFRAFVPYFYYLIAQSPPLELSTSSLGTQSGWCVGDPHLENFGVVLEDSGTPVFTMNDLDDAGPCPLYADLLRYLTSALVFDPTFDLDPLLDRYQRALNGESPLFSPRVEELLNASEGGNVLDPSVLKSQNRLKRGDGVQDLKREESDSALQVLRSLYGSQVRLIDGVRSKWYKGGSGGMLYLRLLVEGVQHPQLSDREVFDFKQMQRPAIFPVASGMIPEDRFRFERTRELERGAYSSLVSLQVVNGLMMMLQPRWSGVTDTNLSGDSDQSVREFAADEAAVLGKLHAEAAFDLIGYRQAFRSASKEGWRRAAGALARENLEAFEAMADGVLASPGL